MLASGEKIDSPENQREPSSAKAVTLQVTPEQAEKLVLAANEGKLQLVMRNYSDKEDTQTSGANKKTLLSGDSVISEPPPPSEHQIKAPVRRPVVARRIVTHPERSAPSMSRNSIELIEGAKRREVELP